MLIDIWADFAKIKLVEILDTVTAVTPIFILITLGLIIWPRLWKGWALWRTAHLGQF